MNGLEEWQLQQRQDGFEFLSGHNIAKLTCGNKQQLRIVVYQTCYGLQMTLVLFTRRSFIRLQHISEMHILSYAS